MTFRAPSDPREHWCAAGCGRWGAWGIGPAWWCKTHRPAAEEPTEEAVTKRTTFAELRKQGSLF